jgi:primosomal protein N' (replication factor Y)
MMPCYIEVAVSRLSALFHYRLPPHIVSSALHLGTRLLVPFGTRVEIAYFVRVINQPEVAETKEILAVLDHTPLFSKSLIKLLQWISDYYCAPLGAVIQTALPKEGSRHLSRRFELTKEGQTALETGHVKSDHPKQMMNHLLGGTATETLLRKKMGAQPFKSALSSLKRNQWITQQWEIHTAIPKRKKEKPIDPGERSVSLVSPYALNTDQQAAYATIILTLETGSAGAFLLHGVTGSGKTEVYLQVIEKALFMNRGAIVLVPEIGLTPQLAARFEGRFGKTVAVLHSGLSVSERHHAWRRILEGEARIAIGARSALFAPMENVGVIIVDEEHDASYKQEEGVRYNARDAALVYGKLLHAVVVLGTATPSFESFHNGLSGKYKMLSLLRRVSDRPLPAIRMIDLRKREEWVKPFLTRPLITAIEQRLARSEQVILFVNRRGHTPSLLCGDCGHQWRCENCSVSLAFHKKIGKLLCHYCGFSTLPTAICPTCQGTRLVYLGIGTEQAEEEIQTIFPSARVLRMDRDTTARRSAHHRIVTAMETQNADILIGTQMVAKGHDFQNVTLVGVICADLSLHFPDFRASERTFQLLSQVAGRAGRGNQPGEVLIQTFQPEQPLFQLLSEGSAFYDVETPFRREIHYPPFGHLILLILSHRNEADVANRAEELANRMDQVAKGCEVLGPVPASLSRLRKEYRYQILLKCADRVQLRAVLKKGLDYIRSVDSKGIRLIVDVDPQNVT